MVQQTWTYDAPTGTYKNHAMSRKLFEASLPKTVFMDFVDGIDGYGRGRGESITLTRVAELTEPTTPDLTEGIRIPEDTLALSTTSVTVVEIGRAVPYSSLSDDLSEFNMTNIVQKRLRNQMAQSLDTKASTPFKATQIKYVPTGLTSSTITTNGTAGAQATANMNVFHCEEIRDYMFDTLFVPPLGGGDYVGIFRTLGLRGIKRDPDWEEWHKYTDPRAKFNSEVGRVESIRFVETNHSQALAKIGASSVLGEGVIFGEDAVIIAEALTPEIRVGIPGDHGRAKSAAWYGILEFGLIWDTGNAGEAKVLHVTST